MPRQSAFQAACLLPLSALLVGCLPPQGGAGLGLWAAGPAETIRTDTPPRTETDYFSQSRNQIELHGAVNEIVAFQLVIEGTRGASRITPQFEPLTGEGRTLPSAGFRAWLQRPVVVSPAPAWYLRRRGAAASLTVPDLLVPLTSSVLGGGVPISAGEKAVLWIEYRIPRDAAPGNYTGGLTLRAAERVIRRTAIGLTVWPFAIPEARHVTILAGVDAPSVASSVLSPGTDAASALMGLLSDDSRIRAQTAVRDVCRLLEEHRLNPYLSGVHPTMRYGATGSVELVWDRYDALAAPLIDGEAFDDREPLNAWPLPLDRNRPAAEALGGMASPQYARVLREYVAACAAHFEQRGWKDRAFIDITGPVPDRPSPADYDNAARLGRICELAETRLPFVVNLFPMSLEEYGWPNHVFADLRPVADIWAPPARFFPVERMAQARQLGARTWIVPDLPAYGGSVAAEAEPSDVRSVSWHAFLNESDVMLPRAVAWPDDLKSTVTARPYESSAWLVYPGAVAGVPGCLPSLRLKRLLLAAQDAEYLWLLKRNGREATARLVARTLVKATGTEAYLDQYADAATHTLVHDPATWDTARRLMGEELMLATRGAPASPDAEISQRLDWSRFFASCRQVVVWSEGARWIEATNGTTPEMTLEVRLTVENQRNLPVSGTLAFGSLPEGWSVVADQVPIGPLPEHGRGRFRLTVKAPAAPMSLNGHVDLPVQLSLGRDETVNFNVTVSTITAMRRLRPIVIDGRLDDWDLGRGNVAADFRSIGPAPAAGVTYSQQSAAAANTLAYVMRDEEHLYLGIRCQGGSVAAPGEFSDNQVSYDDLLPVGDELVEVLLDPTNRGGDSFDLFHLVFKRHGSMWAEQGISLGRPIGRYRSWGLEVVYATQRDSAGWTVEARVPVAAFGAGTVRQRVWGINFGRYSRGQGEYSNWAGAVRYCYNPRSLGNLVWQQ